jgi:hypothetical protein
MKMVKMILRRNIQISVGNSQNMCEKPHEYACRMTMSPKKWDDNPMSTTGDVGASICVVTKTKCWNL